MQRKNRLKIWTRVKINTEGAQDAQQDIDPICPSQKLRMAGFEFDFLEKQSPPSILKKYSLQDHTLRPWGHSVELVQSQRKKTPPLRKISRQGRKLPKSAPKFSISQGQNNPLYKESMLEKCERIRKKVSLKTEYSSIVCEYPFMESKSKNPEEQPANSKLPRWSKPLYINQRLKQNYLRLKFRKIQKMLLI